MLAFAGGISRTLAAAAPAATIKTCFASESDCAALAIRAVDRAAHEILVGPYGLTTGSGTVEALLRGHLRDVEIKLIADKTTPWGRRSGTDPLAAAESRSGSITARGSRMPRRW